MSIKLFILWALGFATLGTYLFATAPPPLEQDEAREEQIPIEKALALLNAQNEEVRALYAKEIVGEGKKQGLAFDERWKRSDIDAGPLPALFLRETAFYLEGHPTRLSLFLGSDRPINKANEFSGTQAELFDHIKETGEPESFYSKELDLYVAMFPDTASAEACVDCHNQHASSPKHDWRLGDIMGATTWSYPQSHVSIEEVLEMSDALLAAIEHTYGEVLAKFGKLGKKPRIGKEWPRDGYALPSGEVFMKEVRTRTAPRLLEGLLSEVRKHDDVSKEH